MANGTQNGTLTAAPQQPALRPAAPRGDGWGAFFNAWGWNNKNTGQGIRGQDRRLADNFAAKPVLTEQACRDLYRFDGMARRIVDLAVEAMTSKGFEITGDPDGMVVAHLEETGILQGIENMLRWARQFGGSLGIIGADDGQEYKYPLNEKRIKGVHYLHVYDRYRVSFTTGDLYQKPEHPKFGQPEWYTVIPPAGTQFRVHETRTIRMLGLHVDALTAIKQFGWGDSCLQPCVDDIRDLANVFSAGSSILEDFITETVSIKGLADLIATPGGEEVIVKRLQLIAKSRHITNSRMLDADNETFNKVASSVAGVPDMLDRYFNKLAMSSGYPVTLLAGQAPAGLQATGDSDSRNFYDKMESGQKSILKPALERIIKLLYLSTDGDFNGQEPETWAIKFCPLWQPTAKEKTDMGKTKADTLAVYIEHNVMNEDEARDVIRDEYNLEGDAPEPPEPVAPPPLPGTKPGDPPAGDQPPPPADPKAAADAVLAACRALMPTAQRGDADEYQIAAIHLTADGGHGPAWLTDHGFRADGGWKTTRGMKYRQPAADSRDLDDLRSIRLEPGIEITLGRKRG